MGISREVLNQLNDEARQDRRIGDLEIASALHGHAISGLAKTIAEVRRTVENSTVVNNSAPADTVRYVTILDAIKQQCVIGFHYTDADGESSYRVVSAYELTPFDDRRHAAANRTVLCWDHGRKGIRRFRTSRIKSFPVAVPSEDYRRAQD